MVLWVISTKTKGVPGLGREEASGNDMGYGPTDGCDHEDEAGGREGDCSHGPAGRF